MYPKNKPLPPEAASRAACVVSKKGNDKASNEVAMGMGGAVSSSLASTLHRPHSYEDSSTASSSHCSPLHKATIRQGDRSSLRIKFPPSYVDGMNGSPLGNPNFQRDALGSVVGSSMLPGGGGSAHNHCHLIGPDSHPPPYDGTISKSGGSMDERAFVPVCNMTASPLLAPPSLLHQGAPGLYGDGSYYNGQRLHGSHSARMLDRPPLPPWLMYDNANSTIPMLEMEHKPLPPFGDCNGIGHPPLPVSYTPQNSFAPDNMAWKSCVKKEQSTHHKGAENNNQYWMRASLKAKKRGNTERSNEPLRCSQCSALAGSPASEQKEKNQKPLSVPWEETTPFSPQHRNDVALLMQVIAALLERITEDKSLTSPSAADNTVQIPQSDCTHFEQSKEKAKECEEYASTLSHQLRELQDAVVSLQVQGASMSPNRRQLIAAILSIPQLIPLSISLCDSSEESASSASAIDAFCAKDPLSSNTQKEVKVLMNALDFETTRPLALNLIAPSS